MADIGALYQAAVGQEFTGLVVRHHQIHQKVWTVVEITDEAAGLIQALNTISRAVGEGQIWRGFILENRQLYVDQAIDEGVAGDFKITGYVGPFRVESNSYRNHQGYCFIITAAV